MIRARPGKLLLIWLVLLLGSCTALRQPESPAQALERMVEDYFDEGSSKTSI